MPRPKQYTREQLLAKKRERARIKRLDPAYRAGRNAAEKNRIAKSKTVQEHIRAYQRAHSQRPEVQTRKRAYYQRPETKARYLAHSRKAQGLPAPTRPCPERCECCGRAPTAKALSLDHCHTTGAFRGWLCDKCNTALGLIGDTAESALRLVAYFVNAHTDLL